MIKPVPLIYPNNIIRLVVERVINSAIKKYNADEEEASDFDRVNDPN